MGYSEQEIAEMVTAFTKNDFTKNMIASIPDATSSDETAIYKKAIATFKKYWNDNLKSFGMKRRIKNFSKAFPICFLSEKDGDYFSKQIAEMMQNPKKFEKAIEQFTDMYGEQIYVGCEAYAKSVNKNVDDLTNDEICYIVEKVAEVLDEEFIRVIMYGQQVPELYKVAHENSAHEDYDISKGMENLDLVNFYNHWYHLKTQTGEMLSLEKIQNKNGTFFLGEDEWAYEEYKIFTKEFYKSLDEIDRKIFCLRAKGYTNEEIAKALNYKSTSAVTKRLAKIKEEFLAFSKTGELRKH